jgi:hypothetical protein
MAQLRNIENTAYDASYFLGEIQLGWWVLVCLLFGIGLFTTGYYNHKNWNYNLIDIPGTVVSIDGKDNQCDSYQTTDGSNPPKIITHYNCLVTVKYIKNDSSTYDTVQLLSTNNSLPLSVGQTINLTYDSSQNTKPTLHIFRLDTVWYIGCGFMCLLFALINIILMSTPALKPLVAFEGALGAAGQVRSLF